MDGATLISRAYCDKMRLALSRLAHVGMHGSHWRSVLFHGAPCTPLVCRTKWSNLAIDQCHRRPAPYGLVRQLPKWLVVAHVNRTIFGAISLSMCYRRLGAVHAWCAYCDAWCHNASESRLSGTMPPSILRLFWASYSLAVEFGLEVMLSCVL
jgi:hypothetical protein